MPQRRHHRDPPRSGGGPTRDAPESDIGGDAACHRRDSGAAVWLKPADAERDPITIGIWLGNYTRGSGEVFGRVPGLGRCVVHSRRRVNPGPDGPSPVVGEGPGRWPRPAATTRCPPNCSPPQSVCKSAAPAAARFRGRGDQPLPQDVLSNNAARPGWYPRQDWGVGRAEAIGYLAEVIGVEFACSACTFCPSALATEKGRACTRHAVARGWCRGHRFQDCHCGGSGVAAACSTVSTTLTQVHLELINDRVGRHGIG